MTDIKGRKPRVVPARVVGLRLTLEERFLMDRIDGELSVSELARVTGLEEGRVEQFVSRLAFEGAIELAPEPKLRAIPDLDEGGTTSMAELAAALGMDPTSFAAAESTPRKAAAPVATLEPVEGVESVEDLEALAELVERPLRSQGEAEPPDTLVDVASEALDESGGQVGSANEAELEELPELEEVAEETAPSDVKEDEVSHAVAERNYRQVYEMRWSELPVDQRENGARVARGADLHALCLDPDARVIAAILENATCGLDHVRRIAFYHRTGTGLEIVARRQDWLRDVLVERRLLHNPMIGEVVLGRVMGPKRLLTTYKIAIDRDVPELTRVRCRGYVRQKWQTAASEERADFLLRTEARCLGLMTGCTFDAKTTAILCGRPINSAMFVQSVAKFGASPPGLLAHLMKQPFVRKNAPLKKMLLAHPNMPGDVKRSL
jgi:hypothetical protein